MWTGKKALLYVLSTDKDRPIVPKHYGLNVFNGSQKPPNSGVSHQTYDRTILLAWSEQELGTVLCKLPEI